MDVFPVAMVGVSGAFAFLTTRRAAHYGTTGMAAGMAAMMAAMGTGLSIGYAAGMAWDLGWANVAGIFAGAVHGLWMGRRSGPMAALDGIGGGVMGGMMGPMLGVMLLFLPLSLSLTAVLMVAVQAAFSVGAVYLVAEAAGAARGATWLDWVGRILGAQSTAVDTEKDHYATLGIPVDAGAMVIAEAFLTVSRRAAKEPERAAAAYDALAVLSDPVRRAKYDLARLEALACCPPEPGADALPETARPAPSGSRQGISTQGKKAATEPAIRPPSPATQARSFAARGGTGVGLFLFAAMGLLGIALWLPSSGRGPDARVDAGWQPANAALRAASDGPAAAASSPAAPGAEVQKVAMTLRYPRYEPSLVEVRSGIPVRLTLQAIGDPG